MQRLSRFIATILALRIRWRDPRLEPITSSMTTRTETTGLELPPELHPRALDAISRHVAEFNGSHPVAGSSFAAAWNGLGYRFRAAHDLNQAFAEAMALGDAPVAEHRYRQEQALFGFASAALSAVACSCFGIYCIGHIANAKVFALSTDRDLRFNPADVQSALSKAFPADALTSTLAGLLRDRSHLELVALRNMLVHRGTLPRSVVMEVGKSSRSSGAFVPSNPLKLSCAGFRGHHP